MSVSYRVRAAERALACPLVGTEVLVVYLGLGAGLRPLACSGAAVCEVDVGSAEHRRALGCPIADGPEEKGP